MPSTSPAQAKLMRAVAHGWHPTHFKGPSVAVAKEFVNADKKAHSYDIGGAVGRALHISRLYGKKYAEGGDTDLKPQDQEAPSGLQQFYENSIISPRWMVEGAKAAAPYLKPPPSQPYAGPLPSLGEGLAAGEDMTGVPEATLRAADAIVRGADAQLQPFKAAEESGGEDIGKTLSALALVAGPGTLGATGRFGDIGVFGGKGAYASDAEARAALEQRFQQANQLMDRGAPETTIWKKTGTGLDPSGEQFFEIPDEHATLSDKHIEPYPLDIEHSVWLPQGKTVPLKEVLPHPELERAYPGIGNTPITGGDPAFMGERAGLWDPVANTIEIMPQDPESMRLTLLHEVNHKIQFLEGFGQGGTWHSFLSPEAKTIANNLKRSQQNVASYFRKNKIQPNVGLDAMRTALDDPSRLTYGQQTIVQKILTTGGYSSISDMLYAQKTFNFLKAQAYDNYLRLSGEAMSRNVEWRSLLGAAERGEITPYSSLGMMAHPLDPDDIILHPSQAPVSLAASEKPHSTIPQQDTLGFYSKADEIAANGPAKSTAEGWIGFLKNKGLRSEEDQYLGLSDWLKGQQGQVTKGALQQYIRSSRVPLREEISTGESVPLPGEWGGTGHEAIDIAADYMDRYGWEPDFNSDNGMFDGFVHRASGQETGDWRGLPEELQEAGRMIQQGGIGAGTNHPAFEPWHEGEYGSSTKYSANTLPGGANYKELKIILSRPISHQDFIHAHFENQPNILAYARLDDRVIAGKKTLFVNEVQSDWHQVGSKYGYHDPDLEPGMQNWDDADFEKAPEAPYKKNWPEFMLKRIIRYAAENGYEQIAWPGAAETVAQIEHWPSVGQKAGKWTIMYGPEHGPDLAHWGQNVDPVVNRYLRALPESAQKIGGKFGATVYNEASNQWPVKVMPLTEKLKDKALKEGFSDYKRGGKTMPKKYALGGAPFINPRQQRFEIGDAWGGGMPGVGKVSTGRTPSFHAGHVGMIHSSVPGRTDKIPLNVKGGSYVLPASVVSGMGQGNSMAGASALNKLFKMGPYGAGSNKIAMPRVNMGHMSAMPRIAAPKVSNGNAFKPTIFHTGGTPEGKMVPIIVAGGEFVIDPETVRRLGGGDLTEGHRILDALVLHIRKKTISDMKGEKPPKR